MLKIYLDWNCITHLKENKDLYDFLVQNHNMFIFPYSPAHFEDLLRSSPRQGKGNKYFFEDLNLLSKICGDDLIMYDENKKRVVPYIAKPKEYLAKSGSEQTTIDFIFKNVTFTDYLKNTIEGESYELVSKMFNQIHLDKMETPFPNKSITNGVELMDAIWNFLHEMMTTNNYNRKASKQISQEDIKESMNKISYANSDTVFGLLNNQIKKLGSNNDVETEIHKILYKSNKDNELAKFVSLYLVLDICGFRQDKNHNLINISTDAKHGYYASYCDVLVSNDKKMRDKNRAVYDSLGIKTKVISLNEIKSFIQSEIGKEFDFMNYFRTLAADLHFHNEYNKGDVHTKFLVYDSPFLGIFNYGMVQYFIDTKSILYTFKIKIDKQQSVFFTELDRFYDSIRIMLKTDRKIKAFDNNFVDKIKKKDANANYLINVNNKWNVIIANDNECNGLPAIYITREIDKK